MKMLPDRLVWTFWRRHRLRATLPSFWASALSYCCPNTTFSGYHTIKKKTEIYSSKIGRFTYFAENVRTKNCLIGPLCSIGPDVILGDLPRHPTDLISTHPLFYSEHSVAGITFAQRSQFIEYAQTEVGADVFIGARALIMPGIKLGHGCIIGAGAVVTRDVPPYAIVAGVPARLVRFRFGPEIVERLLGIAWWDWPLEKLKKWQTLHEQSGPITVDRINHAIREIVK